MTRAPFEAECSGRVFIGVLGPLAVNRGSDQLRPSVKKDAALVAYLALRAGEMQSRSTLAGLLWGESAERQARDSLRQSVLRLRRLFAEHDGEALRVDRETVGFDRDRVIVDAILLENAFRSGQPDAIASALELLRGKPLDGLETGEAAFQEWALGECARLNGLAVDAGLALLRHAENAGRGEWAAHAAQRVLAVDPLNEEAVRFLMQRLASRGERRRAVELFHALRDRLSDELSVDPEPATTDLFLALSRRGAQPPDLVEAETPKAEPRAGSTSIAVLPFKNIGDDLSQDFFAEGLAEDIATDLSRVPGLTVAHQAAAASLRSSVDPAAAARTLGVAHTLAGSVRRDEGRVRVSARLIEGVSGRQIWAERYDRPLTGVFALQDELARSVVEALKLTLLNGLAADRGRRGTGDVAAYDLYLKARSFHLRGADAQSLRVARALYARAIERDPGYARAHAELAICMSHLSMNLPNGGEDAFDECLERSLRALELDPYLAEAHAARGLALYASGRYGEAEAALDVAMRLDSQLFEAVFFQARNRRLQGNRQQAAKLFDRAATLRPDDYRSIGLLGEELQALGRHNEAAEAFGRCFERLEAEVEAHPGNADALAFGAAVLADLGRHEQAREWAEWALVLGEDQRLVRYNIARTWLMLGRRTEALDQLEMAFETPRVVRRRLALWLEHDEDLASLRGEPRFRRLLAARDGR